jgi:RimJ/RimL family protein N-acetyltransferase
MNVTYRDVDFDSDADCELLSRWNNDPALKHLYNRFDDAESFAKVLSPADLRRRGQTSPTERPHGSLMVVVDGAAVGQATFEFDPPKLLCTLPHTAWIALVIGEAHQRGRGLGKRVVAHLEERVVRAGAERIEVGVFAYNALSLGFFGSLGYEEFARTPPCAWWDGRLWADVRMRKTL